MDIAGRHYSQDIVNAIFAKPRPPGTSLRSGGLKKLATLTNFYSGLGVLCCRAKTSQVGSQPRHAALKLAAEPQWAARFAVGVQPAIFVFWPRHEYRGRRRTLPDQGQLPQGPRATSRVRSQDSHGASHLCTVPSRTCAAACRASPGSDRVEARCFTVRAGLLWRGDVPPAVLARHTTTPRLGMYPAEASRIPATSLMPPLRWPTTGNGSPPDLGSQANG
jgi:hypothetical protein